jgi:GntR family transcriptional regulator/MocR family aminotransferase
MPTRPPHPFILLDATHPSPLYDQLYRALRKQVLSGTLAAGEKLASTRTLAVTLGISRFTVVNALERLRAEGYLSARRGAGTFVVRTLPERTMRARGAAEDPRAQAVPSAVAPGLSKRGTALTQVVITGPRLDADEARAFQPRRPPLDVFPLRPWARLVRRQWSRYRYHHLDYGAPAGYEPLREAIARHVVVTRGVRCSANQIIVTSGSQQAFDILFKLLLDPGDQVWVEEPGYLDVRGALIGAGAKLVPVPVDGQGLDVAAGIELARRARLAVVSPSHQYPTGVTLSASRRAALLAWARAAGAWIVEDDYDSYFRYRGQPMSALQALDPHVVYVGTFSKTMYPSLRLGFCVVPESLVDAAANARAIADRNSPIADQAALAAFIEDGHYERHLRRVRVVCQERYEAMRFHAARVLGDQMSVGATSAGTHVIATVADGRPSTRRRDSLAIRISRAAAIKDLVVFPLSRYCLQAPARDALVLGYGALRPAAIASGLARLARVIEQVRGDRA